LAFASFLRKNEEFLGLHLPAPEAGCFALVGAVATPVGGWLAVRQVPTAEQTLAILARPSGDVEKRG